MIKIEEGDFVIFLSGKQAELPYKYAHPASKYTHKRLGQVTKVKGKYVYVDYEVKHEVKSKKIKSKEIVANLGDNPVVGKSHGVNVEPYRETVETPYGEYLYYCDPQPRLKNRVEKAMDTCMARNSNLYVPLLPLEIHIKYPQGRYAGSYTKGTTATNGVDIVLLKPHIFKGSELQQLIDHELAHGVWLHVLNEQQRADWINTYEALVYQREVTTSDIALFRKEIHDYPSSTVYARTLDEEDKEKLKACVKYIATVHKIKAQDLNYLLVAGESVSHLFPDVSLPLVGIETLVSEYAGESPQELFAESLRFYIQGKKLPKTIRSLIKNIRPKIQKISTSSKKRKKRSKKES